MAILVTYFTSSDFIYCAFQNCTREVIRISNRHQQVFRELKIASNSLQNP